MWRRKKSVRACNFVFYLRSRTFVIVKFFSRRRRECGWFSFYPSTELMTRMKEAAERKEKNVLHGALSYSQNTHFGDIFKCRPSMTYTHFSISIIGGCRVRGGNEWRLSTGRSFGWLCWNGFWSGSGLIIGGTLISTLDEEPSRVATQRNFWSDWAFNSLRDGSAKLIHKAEFWFLNYPPKRGDLVFLLLLWIFFFFFAI